MNSRPAYVKLKTTKDELKTMLAELKDVWRQLEDEKVKKVYKRSNNINTGFLKPVPISDELAAFIGLVSRRCNKVHLSVRKRQQSPGPHHPRR